MNHRVTLLLCFLIIFAAASSSETQEKYRTSWGKRDTPRNPHSPKIYEINLDSPYEDRWREVIQDHKQAIDKLLSHLWIKNLPMGLVDSVLYPLAYRYNSAFTEEIQAMANLADISFTKLFLLNFLFDFAAACSSVLVEDPDGNVIHARTLDFDMTPYVSDLAFHGKYYKNGELLYEALDIAGYTGIVTAYKPDAYSFSINQYLVDNFSIKHAKLVVSYLKNLVNGKVTPPYVVRKAFEEAEDYDSFIQILCDTDTISRAYYIVAGSEKGQGVVITKFEDEVRNITRLDADNGRWYIAQTNYERDEKDPEHDNRKTAEDDRLEAIGREDMTMERLFEEVMDAYPTFNAETVHTTVMKPSQNYFDNTIWF